MKNFKIAAAATAVALLPFLAMAQIGDIPANFVDVKGGEDPLKKVVGIVETIGRIMLYALLILAGIFIIYASFLYLTAAGDPEKVKHASSVIIYAAVAIGVGLLSQVIVAIAKAIVGAK